MSLPVPSAIDHGLTFRDATADDVPTIVALYADDDLGREREAPGDPLPEAYWTAFRAIDADPRHRLVVVEQDGAVVGTLQLSFLPHLAQIGMERAQLQAVRIAAPHRSRGLGRLLVAWAIDEARARGCGMVELTSDSRRPDAHRFYTAFGFVASHVGMKLDLHR